MLGGAAADLLHQPVHVQQLPHHRPGAIAGPPAGARRKPDGERLGEILVGVLLGIGAAIGVDGDVLDVFAAQVVGAEDVAVGAGEAPEHLLPARAAPQAVGVVDGMAGLVAQQGHDALAVLDLPGLLLLDARQALIGQVERDADDRRPVGAAPAVGQVDIGLETKCPWPPSRGAGGGRTARRANRGGAVESDIRLFRSSKRTVSQLCTSEWIVLALMTTFGLFQNPEKSAPIFQPAAHSCRE